MELKGYGVGKNTECAKIVTPKIESLSIEPEKEEYERNAFKHKL